MPLPDFISMEHVYHTDRHELNLTRITFWVYLISVPVILFVVAVPYIQGRPFQFTPFLLIFVGIAGFLLFQTVRILRIGRAGQPDIAVLNFATHPDVVGGERLSGDWPAWTRRRAT